MPAARNRINQQEEIMNKGLIWTIVGILLIVALVIWITRAI